MFEDFQCCGSYFKNRANVKISRFLKTQFLDLSVVREAFKGEDEELMLPDTSGLQVVAKKDALVTPGLELGQLLQRLGFGEVIHQTSKRDQRSCELAFAMA